MARRLDSTVNPDEIVVHEISETALDARKETKFFWLLALESARFRIGRSGYAAVAASRLLSNDLTILRIGPVERQML